MNELRKQLSVMLDLAMVVSDGVKCTCPPVSERTLAHDTWSGSGHQSGCDHQVARNVLHTSARMLDMKPEARADTVYKLQLLLRGP